MLVSTLWNQLTILSFGSEVVLGNHKITTCSSSCTLPQHRSCFPYASWRRHSSSAAMDFIYTSLCEDALLYFQSKFGDDLLSPLNTFKAARYFMSSKINEMLPTASDIESLTIIPFFNSAAIASLKEELPIYLSKFLVLVRLSTFWDGGDLTRKHCLSGHLWPRKLF